MELITTESVSQKEVPIIAELLVLELLKESKKPKWVKLPGGVIYCDIYTGNGKEIKGGSAVHLHLRGYLEDGTEFVNTFRERLHFFFTFNVGETIPGFEQGIASMRERGKRIVIIPPELAFGAEGYETEYIYIPPYSTLIYEVSLLFVREPEWDKLNMFK
ncbi:MAG: FKBP-type peptidyl-prolyl cis-trans isomerase [Candidatus Sumerlaeia bacterium]|nr:FKBP-type peptidyl-prolyl cis-trans isomerase [Candidatus Sumerlaeia bacterium]